MSIFSKAKKLLQESDACVIYEKNGDEKYVMIRWSKWMEIKKDLEDLKKQKEGENEEDVNYDVDINDIPV